MNESCVTFRAIFLSDTECSRNVAYILYYDKRRESCCKQACPRRFVMKSRKGKRAERSRNERRAGLSVRYKMWEWRRGREQNGRKRKEKEKPRWRRRKTNQRGQGASGKSKWIAREFSFARAICEALQHAKYYERCRCIFVFRFRGGFTKQLGHKSLAPTVKYLQIHLAMEFADSAHVRTFTRRYEIGLTMRMESG